MPIHATDEAEETNSLGLGDVIDFMRLLWAVDHGLEASSKQMDALFGVTGPQRLVIRIVGKHPGISAGGLADALHVHPSTLTGVLGRLSQRGIVTRQTDPADGRRALFALTAQGRKLDSLRSGTIEAKIRSALGRLPERDVAAARSVLGELADALMAPPKDAKATKATRTNVKRVAPKPRTAAR